MKYVFENRIACVNNVFFSILIVVACVFVGMFLLVVAYSLPTEPMFDNVKENQKLIKSEGNYYYSLKADNTSRLDNYTDFVMLSTAIFPNDTSLIESTLLNKKFRIVENGTTSTDPQKALLKMLENEGGTTFVLLPMLDIGMDTYSF